MSYLAGTKKMKRVIGMNWLDYIQTWIDASYAIHRDMRGHTGGVIKHGKGYCDTHLYQTKDKH